MHRRLGWFSSFAAGFSFVSILTTVFQLFALDRKLSFDHAPSRGAVVEAMTGRVLAKGVLVATYERT